MQCNSSSKLIGLLFLLATLPMIKKAPIDIQ